jgi:hypothetical protein
VALLAVEAVAVGDGRDTLDRIPVPNELPSRCPEHVLFFREREVHFFSS